MSKSKSVTGSEEDLSATQSAELNMPEPARRNVYTITLKMNIFTFTYKTQVHSEIPHLFQVIIIIHFLAQIFDEVDSTGLCAACSGALITTSPSQMTSCCSIHCVTKVCSEDAYKVPSRSSVNQVQVCEYCR